MFLIDKYSPDNIEDASFHKEILNKLVTIASDEAVPHTIFYGPEGSGKKTLIYIFLKTIYDDSVYDLSEVTYSVPGSGNNETQVKVKQSNYHIVIEPNNNNSDRHLIQGVLKEYVKRVPLDIFSAKTRFKTVLINNVDNLSYYTQTALRRMMEIYSDTCRFILWCKTLNKVINPIVSRCLSIRVKSPTNNEILARMFHIGSLERIGFDIDEYDEIVKQSKGNFKTCMWLMDLKKYGHNDINVYQKEIQYIVDKVLNCKLEDIVDIRNMMYKIIITNIDEVRIIKDILDYLLDCDNISEESKLDIVEASSDIEINLKKARRVIIHLEAFIQNIMYIIKKNKKN